MRRRNVAVAAALALALIASTSPAQVQQQGATAGTLQLANIAPAARDAFFGGLDAYHTWDFAGAKAHLDRALAHDSTFGLARQFRLFLTSAPSTAAGNAEAARAAREAATRAVPEMTLGLAYRAAGANANRLFATARAMYPNDRRVALDHALSFAGEERLDSLRALVRRHPDQLGAKLWLAYWLTVSPFTTSPQDEYEALNVAWDAVRLAPRAAGSHVALGHVLNAMGRFGEAEAHLAAATRMDPRNEYAYVLLSEIYADDGKPRAVDRARAALDSATAASPHVTRRNNQRATRAFLLFHDGRAAEGMAELATIARDIEAAGGAPANLYAQMAGLAAATGDSAGVDKWVAESRRFPPVVNSIIQTAQANWMAKRPADVRRGIEEYRRMADTTTLAYRYDITRLTGMALLAEGKPAEALVELQKSDIHGNVFAHLALVDAYTALKDQKKATETLNALLARDIANTAVTKTVLRYRVATAKKR